MGLYHTFVLSLVFTFVCCSAITVKIPEHLKDKYTGSHETWIHSAVRQSSSVGINIEAGDGADESNVEVYGEDVHVISNEERVTFGLGDENLKDAVEDYKGSRPDDAYLRSPTPWDDLYTKYSWAQVKTTMKPTAAEILEISTEPVIVSEQSFENESSNVVTNTGSITDSVKNTVTTQWSSSGSFTIGQSISYGISFLGSGVEGQSSLEFTQGWGEGGSESQEIMVGSTSGVSVELDPGESVITTINASRGTMRVKVTYTISLDGSVACNWEDEFEDHHFWAFDVNRVMEAAGIEREKTVTEVIEIGYYGKSSVQTADG